MSHEQLLECIRACEACAVSCEHCADECLSEAHVASMAKCIRLDRDCADICRIASAFMARDSQFSAALCALCAMVCDACREECHKHEMPHCQACADACEKCAQACRKVHEAR